MIKSNIHAAKTHLSKLIEQALAGEEVVIAKAGKALVRLTPVTDAPVERPNYGGWLGSLKGKVHFAPDYDQADAEIERLFEASEIFPADLAEDPQTFRKR